MALRNPQDLYTAGAVVFNTQPYVNFTANLMARKQAKEEAIESYYQNLNKGINPAGTRTQDVPAFMEKVKGFKDYYNQNRDKIKNPKIDNGRAQTEYQTMYQDALNYVQQSKFEEEKKKPLVTMLTDPAKRDRIPDQVLMDLHNHDLPLNDPNRKSFDISALSFDPKPFDQTTYLKGFSDIKMSENAPTVVTDPVSMSKTVTKTSSFDDNAKKTIYGRSAGRYASDPSFKELIDKELTKPEYFDELNDIFKKSYGHDIENAEDAAAAYTISSLQPSVTKVEVKDDTFARQKQMAAINDSYARRRQAIANSYQKGLVDYRKATNKKEQDGVLEGYIERAFEEGKDTNNPVQVKGRFVPGRQVVVPKKFTELYTIDEGKDSEEVPRFVMTSDKKYVVPLYPGRKSNYKSPIPIETFRNEIGQIWLTKKDAAAEMDEVDFGDDEEGPASTAPAAAPKKSTSYPLPKGQPKTVQQNGHTYTYNESTGQYE